MKKLKILSTLFFSIIFIHLLTSNVSATSVQSGTFTYMPAYSEEIEGTYYYSDDYFKQSGKMDNEHLLTMSFNLALSTSEIRGSSYVKKLYEDIGFENISISEIDEKPTKDTIGTAIASKKIGNHTLIAVAVRGEKYESEWANNFIAGKEGNAKGFQSTSLKVKERIQKYIQEHHLTNNKIWIVGYSRAGTIADLLGVYINQNLSEFYLTEDDIYIYAFEPAAASANDTIFENIYIIININDIVPLLYPKNWGFYTNGKIIYIGKEQSISSSSKFLKKRSYSSSTFNKCFGYLQ